MLIPMLPTMFSTSFVYPCYPRCLVLASCFVDVYQYGSSPEVSTLLSASYRLNHFFSLRFHFCFVSLSRDQNGVSQACYIVEIYHSDLEPSLCLYGFVVVVFFYHSCDLYLIWILIVYIWMYGILHVHLFTHLSFVTKRLMWNITLRLFYQILSKLPCTWAPLTCTQYYCFQ